MINPKKYIYPIFVFLLLHMYCTVTLADEKRELIRVCVIDGIPGITITVDGRYKIKNINTGKLLKEGRSLYRVKIFAKKDGLLFGKSRVKTKGIRIIPKKDGAIYIDKWRFRGYVDIISMSDAKIRVVNTLDVEHYLKGVLYHEISHRWPYAVIKAQAIAARTYALYQKQVMKDKDYDLTSDAYSQVYGGRRSEKYRTSKAVNMTKGKVLTYDGKIFPAYYHATCGGYTEDAHNLWTTDIPPLKGTKCGYCNKSKHFYWKRKIKLSEIQEKLKKAGHKKVDSIKSIEIQSRFQASGRIAYLVVKSKLGNLRITGKNFRQAIGANLLRSNNFEAQIIGDIAFFKGKGWGHGVGMCQWGAYFMSRKNYSAEKILQHYYPGATIQQN